MRIQTMDKLPIPREADEIKERLTRDGELIRDIEEEDLHPDYVWENHVEKIVEYGDLQLIRITYPFGSGDPIIHDSMGGKAFKIPTEEANFHYFKDFMAAVVEEYGDCRDAEMKDKGVQVDSTRDMRCKGCGKKYNFG